MDRLVVYLRNFSWRNVIFFIFFQVFCSLLGVTLAFSYNDTELFIYGSLPLMIICGCFFFQQLVSQHQFIFLNKKNQLMGIQFFILLITAYFIGTRWGLLLTIDFFRMSEPKIHFILFFVLFV